MNLKKIGKVFTSKCVRTGPSSYKKNNLPGRGLTKVEKHCCKVPVILVRLQWYLKFLGTFSRNIQISNLMKIRPVGAELFHADRRRNRHDEANSRFSHILRKRLKRNGANKDYATDREILEIPQQTFEKYPNIKFNENPSSGSRLVLCGRTDTQTWQS